MYESRKPLRRSKSYSLNKLKQDIGHIRINQIDRETIVDFGRHRSIEGAGPSTIGMDISYLKTILLHAKAVHGVHTPAEEVQLARVALNRLGLIGKSRERDRRPTQEELDKLFAFFDANTRYLAPMSRIIRFAIATAMRQSEICSFEWDDVDMRRRIVTVRDRKDPRQKDGNHQKVPLVDLTGYDGWALINEQLTIPPITPFYECYGSSTTITNTVCQRDQKSDGDVAKNGLLKLAGIWNPRIIAAPIAISEYPEKSQ